MEYFAESLEGGEFRIFKSPDQRYNYLVSMAKQSPFYNKYLDDHNTDTWIFTSTEGLTYQEQIAIYNDIISLDITPQLLDSQLLGQWRIGKLIDKETKVYDDEIMEIYELVVERFGQPLGITIGTDTVTSTEILANPRLLETKFAKNTHTFVIRILEALESSGHQHLDVRPEYFLIDENSLIKISLFPISRIGKSFF